MGKRWERRSFESSASWQGSDRIDVQEKIRLNWLAGDKVQWIFGRVAYSVGKSRGKFILRNRTKNMVIENWHWYIALTQETSPLTWRAKRSIGW